MKRYRLTLALVAIVAGFGLVHRGGVEAAVTDTLPERLTDEQFWALVEGFSEPNGYFRSDNLVSNEIYYPDVLPALLDRAGQGAVYLGVGPEQNYTYIAALRPKMAFITDVRRGNLYMHLMYKALFELSADRAEFISRLFTKPRSKDLGARATALDIMNANFVDTSDSTVFDRNAKDIIDHLTVTHGFPLSDRDRQGIIQDVYFNFYWFGPRMTYNSSSNSNRGNFVSYHDLMVVTDGEGAEQSFLASEERFQFIKRLHQRNLLVPVVGDFAGAKALRAVGQYVRDHGATIGAFYLSNVEQYLNQDGIWRHFCGNVATMPLDGRSTFIRSSSQGRGGFGSGRGLVNSLGSMQDETRGCRGGPR